MMSRKYLMMHISKYTFNGSVGKVIQGCDILIGMVARIEKTYSIHVHDDNMSFLLQ